MGKPSKRKYLLGLLERTLQIQARHPEPQSFESLLLWIQDRLEQRNKRRAKPRE